MCIIYILRITEFDFNENIQNITFTIKSIIVIVVSNEDYPGVKLCAKIILNNLTAGWFP